MQSAIKAERVKTLQNFDHIIVMSAGKVIDDGSPQELRERPGLYRELLAKQHGKVPSIVATPHNKQPA